MPVVSKKWSERGKFYRRHTQLRFSALHSDMDRMWNSIAETQARYAHHRMGCTVAGQIIPGLRVPTDGILNRQRRDVTGSETDGCYIEPIHYAHSLAQLAQFGAGFHDFVRGAVSQVKELTG